MKTRIDFVNEDVIKTLRLDSAAYQEITNGKVREDATKLITKVTDGVTVVTRAGHAHHLFLLEKLDAYILAKIIDARKPIDIDMGDTAFQKRKGLVNYVGADLIDQLDRDLEVVIGNVLGRGRA